MTKYKTCGSCRYVDGGVCFNGGGEVSSEFSCEQFAPKKLRATAIGMSTLVGYMYHTPFPQKSGNCFSMYVGTYTTMRPEQFMKAKDFRIVNMVRENLDYLIENKLIKLPIIIQPIGENHAIIKDHRIPEGYLDDEYCTICTPRSLMSKEQRERIEDEQQRKIDSGELTIIDCGDGVVFNKIKLGIEKKTITPRDCPIIMSPYARLRKLGDRKKSLRPKKKGYSVKRLKKTWTVKVRKDIKAEMREAFPSMRPLTFGKPK